MFFNCFEQTFFKIKSWPGAWLGVIENELDHKSLFYRKNTTIIHPIFDVYVFVTFQLKSYTIIIPLKLTV